MGSKVILQLICWRFGKFTVMVCLIRVAKEPSTSIFDCRFGPRHNAKLACNWYDAAVGVATAVNMSQLSGHSAVLAY